MKSFLSGSKADLFTSVLYNFYKAPSGFCFDIVCEDEPLIDDPDSPDYNMDMKVTIQSFCFLWQRIFVLFKWETLFFF